MTINPHQQTSAGRDPGDIKAEVNARTYRSKDPFPSIPPALLNSADIADYVSATGMIWPFDDSEERLKSASYLVDILGKCIYWDDKGAKQVIDLQRGEDFVLKPNSIAFVSLEPMFRLPNYIALRFNLEIRHIHKGLLLGTGPLVDPGYVGKLLVPLHNLTANEYVFKGGDHLIWIEFTKLSPIDQWKESADKERKGQFRGFPDYKNNATDPEYYLEKAVGRGRPIRSSIPLAVEEANILSAEALSTAKKAVTDVGSFRKMMESRIDRFRRIIERRFDRFRNILTIAGLIGVAALTYQFYSLVSSTNAYLYDASKEIPDLKQKVSDLQGEIDKLKAQFGEPRSTPPPTPTPDNKAGQQPGLNKRP
jgi:deoxycytidine triphosphate deaminase/cell division protein FtsL